MRAAGYVRVSTRDQADEGLSLDAQLRAIRGMAASNDWELTEYVEAGISASKEGVNRPEFKRLLEDVEARRVDVVIVHKLDRWSRQALDALLAAARDVPSELLESFATTWPHATEEERAEMAQLVFEEVYVDLDAKSVVYVKPRPAMKPLFDILRAERVVLGDPERPEVNQAQLSRPVLALVQAKALYRPSELVA